ncbi:MAG: EF-hand domain-containing protein [Verrucomicrobiota bacterium]
MKTSTFFSTIIISICLLGASHAGGPEPSQVQQFIRAFDQNSDGAVTKPEMRNVLLGMKFRLLDGNADGKLTRAEWVSVPEQRDGLGDFAQCDCDANNHISWIEFSASAKSQHSFARVFQALDYDCDNCITGNDECSMVLVASR